MVAGDRVLYLVRVVSAGVYAALMRVPPAERVLTSTLGYMPMLEFPGVCATLVTQNTVAHAPPTLYPGDYILLLSGALLCQHNWHLNINDDCGHMSDRNTVFPWQLERFLRRDGLRAAAARLRDDFIGNEVVFHDPLPWSQVVRVLDRHNFRLPRHALCAHTPPDTSLRPAYVHPPRYLAQASVGFLRALVAQFAPGVAQTARSKQELAQYLRAHTDKYLQPHQQHQQHHQQQAKRARLDLTALQAFAASR